MTQHTSELLEALQNIIGWMNSQNVDVNCPSGYMNQAYAAIAKAHGSNVSLQALPELIEAAESMLGYQEYHHMCSDETYCEEDREDCPPCKLEKAIAKAKGVS